MSKSKTITSLHKISLSSYFAINWEATVQHISFSLVFEE